MMGTCEIVQVEIDIDSTESFLENMRAVGDQHDIRIVCFNADLMAGRAHVEAALGHAQRSFFKQKPIANSFEMEALLCAAGKRQVQEAMEFGIHEGKNRCYLCLCPGNREAADALRAHVRFVEEDWETLTAEKRERLMVKFGITSKELLTVGPERFGELVVERGALLEVYR